jgi:hypothetical protein
MLRVSTMTAGQRHERREAPGPLMDARRNKTPACSIDGPRGAARAAKDASTSRRGLKEQGVQAPQRISTDRREAAHPMKETRP